jgi:hypothetical protein
MEYQNLVFFFKRHDDSLKVNDILFKDLSIFKGMEKYSFKTTPYETPNA